MSERGDALKPMHLPECERPGCSEPATMTVPNDAGGRDSICAKHYNRESWGGRD